MICKIEKGFPATYRECQESHFVAKSRTFVNSLVFHPEKLEALLETVPSQCSYCDHPLDDWKHKGAIQYEDAMQILFLATSQIL